MQAQTAELTANWENGLRLLHPFFMLQQLSNNAHALCAEELAARGEGLTLSGANAGAQAFGCAQAALLSGAVDAALCVAYDSLLSPEVLIEQGLRGALTTARELSLLRAPYSSTAAGAVPGEAAAALLLVRDEPRVTPAIFFVRGADAAGGGPSTTQQAPSTATLLRAAAQVVTSPLQVVDGAAQALPEADLDERRALAAAGLVADGAVLTATLSGIGQVGAAAPLVQAVLLAAALRLGKLPPVSGLSSRTADAAPDGPLPPLCQAVSTEARAALCLSAGPPRLGGAVHVELEGRT
jgi:3-oxoacyl-(acyl-carrier-protein) synthase